MENTLVSAILGAGTLGLYGFANQLPRFLCESAANPVWATLYVRALQKPQESVLRAYYGLNRALGIVLFPATVLAAASSSRIIGLFLGPAWHAVAIPLSILLPTFVFTALGGQTSALLFAKGRGGFQLWMSGSFTVAKVLAVLLASRFGLITVAAAVGMVNIVCGFVAIIAPARIIGTSPRTLFRGLLAPFGCAMVAGMLGERLLSAFDTSLPTLILVQLASILFYVGLLILLERDRLSEDIMTLHGLVRKQPAR